MKRALVTLAIGDPYRTWWRQYAERLGLDLIVINNTNANVPDYTEHHEYEVRGGNTWHCEQRPLSWQILDSKQEALVRLCMAASFERAYFFHFCGRHAAMQYLG